MKCRICSVDLTDANWHPSLKIKNSRLCKGCNLNKGRKWRSENRQQANENALRHYRKNPKKHHAVVHAARVRLRLNMIKQYGGCCNDCGITDVDVLDIDHVFNNGAEHRRKKIFGYNLYRLLKKQGFPKNEYQLLCRNCNWKKELRRRRNIRLKVA